MKFKMNNRTYEIKEVSQEDLRLEVGEIEGEYFGLTLPKKQEIWLWQDLKDEQKRMTLIHELSHCYMFNYITFNKTEFSEDDWADINANSHDIIHKIVEQYFSNEVKIDISCEASAIAKAVNKELAGHITRI